MEPYDISRIFVSRQHTSEVLPGSQYPGYEIRTIPSSGIICTYHKENKMAREGFINTDDRKKVVSDTIWGMSRGVFAIVAIIIVAAVIGSVSWGISVATSDVKGRGDAVVQKNSAVNRIEAQAQFEQNFADVKKFTLQLRDAHTAVADFNTAHPNVGNGTAYDPLAEQLGNLQRTETGLRQQCLRVQTNYEAATRQYTSADFKAVDLPFRFDPSDSAFGTSWAFSDYNCEVK
ncbi:MAG: hypothetical protein WCI47_00940 [bacterium]